MEKIRSIYQDIKRGLKRFSTNNEDIELPIKKKFCGTEWPKISISTECENSGNQRNLCFANDRLKRLREQISDSISQDSLRTLIKKSPRSKRKNSIISKSYNMQIPDRRTSPITRDMNVQIPDCPISPVTRNKFEEQVVAKAKYSISNEINNQNFNDVAVKVDHRLDNLKSISFQNREGKGTSVIPKNRNLLISRHETPKTREMNIINSSEKYNVVSKSAKHHENIKSNTCVRDSPYPNKVNRHYSINSVQDRLKKFKKDTCLPHKQNLTKILNMKNDLEKNSTKLASKMVNFTSTSTHKGCDVAKIKSSKNNTNGDINYGHILNLLYNKYFCETKKDQLTSLKANSFSNEQIFTKKEELMDWEEENGVIDGAVIKNHAYENVPKKFDSQEIYITVDTNVFISDLIILKTIVKSSSIGRTKPIIYVPWMVLSELDFMKDDRNTTPHVKIRVREAVNFIHKTLVQGDRKLIGQSVLEADQQSYIGKSPDDKILSCCLQAKEKYNNVVLLSNDVNLKNKLLVNGIPAMSIKELLTNFSDPCVDGHTRNISNDSNDKIKRVSEIMSSCCSHIICECVQEAFGSIWTKMTMLSDPPWTLEGCLNIFKKYWSSVFKEKLLKQCLKAVEDLIILVEELDSNRNSTRLNEFINGCITLCIFFKDLEEQKHFVENILKEITELTN